MAVEIWPTVHAERSALASDLAGITEGRWATPSLCEGWTVRDVLAHMTATAKISAAAFFPKLLSNGFSFTRMQAKDIEREGGSSGADALSRFKEIVTSTTHPPGPTVTWLGETVVHAEDIRRALGIEHAYPTQALIDVTDSYKRSNLVMGSKKRIAGVRLRATDADWAHGDGPEAAGPMASLLLVVAGRKQALGDLTGDGAAVLAAR
jgi:uncharacterized protein (TIGR03083 family)